jgi:Lipid A 3-O-deacylase (PagL)
VHGRLRRSTAHPQANQEPTGERKLKLASSSEIRRNSNSRFFTRVRSGCAQLCGLTLIGVAATLCHGQDTGPDATTDTASAISPDTSDGTQQTTAPKAVAVSVKPADFNQDIYYKNRLDYSQQLGVLPINIPFVFDVFVGGDYSQKPLHYTLMPVMPSIRWEVANVCGPSFLRGNTDITASLPFTFVLRGPEHRYGAFALGFRRNFVYRNWHSVPYFDFRAGAGFIDAQEPHGVIYAQGQDFTFTLIMGSGVRYSFNPKWSMEVGMTYMHISNLYLSEPKYINNGINVYGPIVGFNKRLGRPKRHT